MSFSKDFMWGSATSAYQVEGAVTEDGKGLNCWDVYSGHNNNTQYNETGEIACDHYYKMREDVALMKEMGLKAYRFSINWTRVIPNGIGEVNEKGLKFYSDLVDELIANGIEPVCTLYHWEYPYELHKIGGWLNKDSSDWFLEYTKVVVDALSDRVSYWVTINEAQCELGCNYGHGSHAPFEKHIESDLFIMGANIILSHGKAANYIRNNAKKSPKIGMAPMAPAHIPLSDSEEAINKARELTFNNSAFPFCTTYWADPMFFGKYPDDIMEKYGDLIPEFTPEEWSLVTTPLDFYGANIYFARASEKQGEYDNIYYQGAPRTDICWVVCPEVMYWSVRFHYERYKVPVIITENGMASADWVCLDGKVHDSYRIDFTQRYLRELKRANDEGYKVAGYMHWSLMDNYEWAHGYTKRFGLIYVDYKTQKRTIKDSGYWYKSVIESNGENL